MNKEQQGLLDEVYKNYWGKVSVNNEEDCLVKQEEGSLLKEVRVLYQQEFIKKCKTDPEFSEKWGLKIEERELNVDELNIVNLLKQTSTKLITITYNDKTIESYE
jgi:hypothetical protein